MTDNNKKDQYILTDEVKSNITDFLDTDNFLEAKKIFLNIHPADQANLIISFSQELKEKIITAIGKNIDPHFLTYLDDEIKNEIIEIIGIEVSADAITKLETDEAVEVISDLEEEGIEEILDHIPKKKRKEITKTLLYPESSIGRLMHQNFIAVNKDCTVGQATRHLQEHKNLPDDFHHILAVDENYSPKFEVLVTKLLVSKKNTLITNLVSKSDVIKNVNVNMDQEDVARLFAKYSWSYAPIIDDNEKLVGIIYANDVIDILEEEAEEDILLLSGVNDTSLHSSPLSIVKSRIPWLFTSLITTMLSATIIALFSDQIEKMVALAVLLPIVAAITGNTASQSLTVLVRSIATGEINNIKITRILLKETMAGSLNGFILSILAFAICYIWKEDFLLSCIFMCSIFLTVIIAGISGALIPLLLNKMKFDPATSSSVFLFTITDVISFSIFLGLAYVIL